LRIKRALTEVRSEIRDVTRNGDGGLYARGLSSEGYSGGYAQALSDVLLVLNGVKPNTRHYWRTWDGEK
jgi:hypothetical protein